MFYVPNLPYAFYLAIRAKSLVFFSAVNPAIKNSGNGSESKFSTIELIPEEFKPISLFVKAKSTIENSLKKLQEHQLTFPLIVKPDIGFRGLLVNRVHTENELISYLEKYNDINLIIQEFIDYDKECGIFYYRLPNEKIGKITSITLKKYLTVIGDGVSTLKELIENNERAKLYIPLLTELHQKDFNLILNANEERILNIIGNHSKGTQFINGNHLITKELEESINSIVKRIPNFYYGRLDIKYTSFKDLLALKNVKILEINGIIAEPTHIYDPTNASYFSALKEIRKHWKLIYKIATINHHKNHIKYSSISEVLGSLKKLKQYSFQLKNRA
jgi:hypothetical protein